MKDLMYGALGGLVGAFVCFGIGFLIAATIGVPHGAYIGVGIEPWNLPGTILGAAAWVAVIWYTPRGR
jgi:hypothetical protein